MKKFYDSEDKLLVSVDCIIFGFQDNELKLLLVKRRVDPLQGQWSLMGGFVKKTESVDQAASRVLNYLTGLDNVFMEQIGVFGEVNRDPGDRVVSAVYYALINIADYDQQLAESHNAVWYPFKELPEVILDHRQMVEKALRQLKRKAAIEPIGFNLLPEYFTLPQLQSLYEAIYDQTLDKRNFRKKVLAMQKRNVTILVHRK